MYADRLQVYQHMHAACAKLKYTRCSHARRYRIEMQNLYAQRNFFAGERTTESCESLLSEHLQPSYIDRTFLIQPRVSSLQGTKLI